MHNVSKKIISVMLLFVCSLFLFACSDKDDCSHNYSEAIIVDSTCTNEGVKLSTCIKCQYSFQSAIQKKSHSYNSQVTKEATCSDEGVITYSCGTCNNSYTENIPKNNNHSYTTEETKIATCLADGVATHSCTECGETYTTSIPKKSEHLYSKNNVCKLCGLGSTISLNMTQAEKELASTVNIVYIVQFNTNVDHFEIIATFCNKEEEIVVVPAIFDIVIKNVNGEIVYSQLKEIKSSDYISYEESKCIKIDIYFNELLDLSVNLDKLYITTYNPGYFVRGEVELMVPAILLLPELPSLKSYSSGSGSSRYTVATNITGINYSFKYYGYSSLYFSGEKTYDSKGDNYSSGAYIGYKIYDVDGFLLVSGDHRTPDISIGDKFKDSEELYGYNKFKMGGIYTLELLDVV